VKSYQKDLIQPPKLRITIGLLFMATSAEACSQQPEDALATIVELEHLLANMPESACVGEVLSFIKQAEAALSEIEWSKRIVRQVEADDRVSRA
jgi:hypothetical protein